MNGKGEEMVKIIFGLIGIVIILAEILNIISTQRLWTKKKSNGFNKKNKDSPSSTSVGRGGII